MRSVEELAEFLARNPGTAVEARAQFFKIVNSCVVETEMIGPVVRTITRGDADGFAWDGPMIGNDQPQRHAGYIRYKNAFNGIPWVWSVCPELFTITADMGPTVDGEGRWACQVECRFLPRELPTSMTRVV